MTITEALAELKTLQKRIDKKRLFVRSNLARTSAMRDPLEKEGGSETIIKREIQAAGDLCDHYVEVRRAINAANAATSLTVCGVTKTVAEWLIWKREIASGQGSFLTAITADIANARKNVEEMNRGATNPTDVVIHVAEDRHERAREVHEEIIGTLDGLLSLHNATVTVEV